MNHNIYQSSSKRCSNSHSAIHKVTVKKDHSAQSSLNQFPAQSEMFHSHSAMKDVGRCVDPSSYSSLNVLSHEKIYRVPMNNFLCSSESSLSKCMYGKCLSQNQKSTFTTYFSYVTFTAQEAGQPSASARLVCTTIMISYHAYFGLVCTTHETFSLANSSSICLERCVAQQRG